MKMLSEAWKALKCLLTKMMDSNDSTADSVVICGFIAMCSLPFLQLIAIVFKLPFDPWTYGSGAGAILLGIGGGTGGRTFLKGRANIPASTPPKDEEIR